MITSAGTRSARRARALGALAAGLALALVSPAAAGEGGPVRIGSKKFTESVILGELGALLVGEAGLAAEHRRELGGTRVLFSALERGEIDAYPEYTGTIVQEILAGEAPPDADGLRAALAARGIAMGRPFGFDNTYAIGLRESRAAELGLRTISDLRRQPELRLGFTSEFMDRGDGWPSLRDAYRLPHRDVRGLDHDLAYRGLESGAIDVMDLYSTDAEIRYYDLRILEDDLRHFPNYEALWLYREELAARAPDAVAALARLEGALDARTMSGLNARAKLERVPERRVAADFLASELGLAVAAREEGVGARLARRTGEHLVLVGVSLGAAVLLGVPLGILATREGRVGQLILGGVGVVQTIPALALLVVLIGPFGIGFQPAVVALFLYSLLPIVRNTHAGLHDIPRHIHESALALGLPGHARLLRVELPMATRAILAGVKTSAVINIGTATLGALIGAGGYGQPILTGIRLDDYGLILEGALPAALLALAAQGVFELVERRLVPLGLRLEPE